MKFKRSAKRRPNAGERVTSGSSSRLERENRANISKYYGSILLAPYPPYPRARFRKGAFILAVRLPRFSQPFESAYEAVSEPKLSFLAKIPTVAFSIL